MILLINETDAMAPNSEPLSSIVQQTSQYGKSFGEIFDTSESEGGKKVFGMKNRAL